VLCQSRAYTANVTIFIFRKFIRRRRRRKNKVRIILGFGIVIKEGRGVSGF